MGTIGPASPCQKEQSKIIGFPKKNLDRELLSWWNLLMFAVCCKQRHVSAQTCTNDLKFNLIWNGGQGPNVCAWI